MTKNIDGLIFGDLKVIRRDSDYVYPNGKTRQKYLCLCSCGKKHSILKSKLVSGKTKSCPSCVNKKKINNILGKTFGYYRVESMSKKRMKSRGKYYNCICKCGNRRAVLGSSLISGKSKSCGCMAKENIRKIIFSKNTILPNDIFGELTVIKFLEYKNSRSWFLCVCNCGKETIVTGNSLKSGNTRSCGCTINESLLAKKLKKYFSEVYSAKTEYKLFRSLDTSKWIKCDIYIEKKNTYIEINGLQHYKINTWHKKAALKNKTTPEIEFKKQRNRDIKVKRFCEKRGLFISLDVRKFKDHKKAIKYIKDMVAKYV